MTALLETYWTIPDRQIETSVVLANPPLDGPQPPDPFRPRPARVRGS